jgi:hypothetical protein
VIRKRIATVFVALFVFFGTVGIALSMTPGHHGKMMNCPFMEHSETMCPMTLPEHLSAWQVMFRAVPVQNMMTLLFLVFSVALFILKLGFARRGTHETRVLLASRSRRALAFYAHSPSKILRLIE